MMINVIQNLNPYSFLMNYLNFLNTIIVITGTETMRFIAINSFIIVTALTEN